MQTLRENKTLITEILSAEPEFILQHVQQAKIVNQREYNNLNVTGHPPETIIINLLDKVMNKGNEKCLDFVTLLQQPNIIDTYSRMEEVFSNNLTAPSDHTFSTGTRGPYTTSSTDTTGQAVGMSSEVCQYRMTSLPRGHCLIINNVHFIQMGERRGSDKDAEVLKDVFQWLGFKVTVLLDQTALQAREELKRFGDETHGDAFVCCVLSHGGKGVIYGTDGEPISTNDLISPFKGTNCSTLIGKPKAFFIQACRGKDTQARVQLEADENPGVNPGHQIYIPADADFLFAMATVEDYYSFRVPTSGSWFIQTLCKQLKQGCPRGDDILTILTQVNRDVSQMDDRYRDKKSREYKQAKQMPEPKYTLTKRLVFTVPPQ
ncbi:caspase-8 [Oncorhynchus mykiss]|uniref:Caspase-8 n=2 Tax=Oncorhynchus mykiss TaxID=8022 RepID=A0A8E8HUL8_ONCMY|nr:caspase-8 [Oncorhynchus mykiss]XP_036822022.1 caspase-8 [Oncorhynchus mykiss]XP_036822023.1 caspase-8 [Oncorhynchus mykiss]QWC93450.1 caspase-20b [Oncorhynchus mykiss]